MDTAAEGTTTRDAAAGAPSPETAPPPGGAAASARRSARRRLARDLTLLGIVGILLIAALGAGAASLYREFYSPAAFVERYLGLLAQGRAADALAMPGVSVESTELEAAGLPSNASEALLRRAALATLTDIEVVSQEQGEDGVIRVTTTYQAGDFPGSTTFEVEQSGWVGVAPTWTFATSPLALMDLSVKGSMTFDVNGFTLDKRQVSPDGVDADPLAPVSLLVFSPGIYSVSVDTTVSATRGAAVLSDTPLANVPVDIQAFATPEFVGLVQEEVAKFLDACAAQDVLQPTGCPFGYVVQDRIASPPVWSIVSQPVISVVPDGAGWLIPPVEAAAHIDVEIRSLFDGEISQVAEDVRFLVTGSIAILPDGRAAITVSTPEG